MRYKTKVGCSECTKYYKPGMTVEDMDISEMSGVITTESLFYICSETSLPCFLIKGLLFPLTFVEHIKLMLHKMWVISWLQPSCLKPRVPYSHVLFSESITINR